MCGIVGQVARKVVPFDLSSGKVEKGMFDEHVSRKRDRSFILWKILNFVIWANRREIKLAC